MADLGRALEPDWQRPSPRLLMLWRRLALGTVAAGGVIAISVATSQRWAGGLAALLVTLQVGALAWVIAGRRWDSWGWAEREDDLVVRRGVVVRRITVVPYGRMQYVDVLAGPLDRRVGIAAVHLHTASAAADIHIPGLEQAVAERMRDRLAALGEARAAGL